MDRKPSWHTEAHLRFRRTVSSTAKPSVVVFPCRDGRLAIVNDAFLDADATTRRTPTTSLWAPT